MRAATCHMLWVPCLGPHLKSPGSPPLPVPATTASEMHGAGREGPAGRAWVGVGEMPQPGSLTHGAGAEQGMEKVSGGGLQRPCSGKVSSKVLTVPGSLASHRSLAAASGWPGRWLGEATASCPLCCVCFVFFFSR